jgi:hypothetical protein
MNDRDAGTEEEVRKLKVREQVMGGGGVRWIFTF